MTEAGQGASAILVDHNLEGHATLLWGTLLAQGWLDLYPLRIVRFSDVGLARNSTDREVWMFVQASRMLLLTANRNMAGEDSLEQVLRTENHADALPVITVSDSDRLFEFHYRELCAERLMEIVLYLPNYLGAARLFIP
ncbi:MAG TPA: ACP S-malonyltransferase [Chloroflexi bacterium]|nr:hypothetical protein [Caldilinea sp.]GIK73173.1 MAG: hypothetical protein BroJett021_21610 [Chloroflexota bacterium]HHY58164.1 ACP S-malonyltransferase [Chloroflexota bacterium]